MSVRFEITLPALAVAESENRTTSMAAEGAIACTISTSSVSS